MLGGGRGRARLYLVFGAACVAATSIGVFAVVSASDAANATVTTLTADSDAVFGQTVAMTASVDCGSATGTGTVSFVEDGSVLATAALDAEGVSGVSVSDLGVGTHVVSASYEGDSTCDASTSDSVTVTVSRASTSVTLDRADGYHSVLGLGVPVVATVAAVPPGSGTPTGSVSFIDDGTLVATASLDGGGTATATLPMNTLGTRTISVEYAGDEHFAASSATATVEVTPVGPGCTVYPEGGYVCAGGALPSSGLPATGRTKGLTLESTASSGSELPNTGTGTFPMLIVAGAALMAGVACIGIGRRDARFAAR